MNHLNQLSFWAFILLLFLFGSCHGGPMEKTWITLHGPDGQVLEMGKDPESSFFGIRMGKPGMPFYRVELSGKESGFLPRITIEGDEQLLGMGFFPFHGVIEDLPGENPVITFGFFLKRKENFSDSSVFEEGPFNLNFSVGPFGLKGGKEKVLKDIGYAKWDHIWASIENFKFLLKGDSESINGYLNDDELFEVKKKITRFLAPRRFKCISLPFRKHLTCHGLKSIMLM